VLFFEKAYREGNGPGSSRIDQLPACQQKCYG
jgi:hypothetical protein